MSLEVADDPDAEEAGLFEPRRLAFIESIADLRPRMHRYCARMTGSAVDGEDVVQEAMLKAFTAWEAIRYNRTDTELVRVVAADTPNGVEFIQAFFTKLQSR